MRNVLPRILKRELEPLSGDGIDVPVRLGSATRTFDVAMRDSSGAVVLSECKRTASPVEMIDLDGFAHRVELARRELGTPVAGLFVAKTAFRVGAVKAGADEGIVVAVLSETERPEGFAVAFLRYDPEREQRLRDVLVAPAPLPPMTMQLGTPGIRIVNNTDS